jgi:hypothetical protein
MNQTQPITIHESPQSRHQQIWAVHLEEIRAHLWLPMVEAAVLHIGSIDFVDVLLDAGCRMNALVANGWERRELVNRHGDHPRLRILSREAHEYFGVSRQNYQLISIVGSKADGQMLLDAGAHLATQGLLYACGAPQSEERFQPIVLEARHAELMSDFGMLRIPFESDPIPPCGLTKLFRKHRPPQALLWRKADLGLSFRWDDIAA